MTLAAIAMFNETRKGVLITLSYRFNTATMMVRLTFFFVGISLVMGRGRLEPDLLAPTLVGYLIWFYAAAAISNMSYSLMEEMQSGTLEQMYMTPAPTGAVILGRSLSGLVVATPMVVAIGAALVLVLDIPFPLRWQALPVFALTMMGLLGLGFMVGGATIIVKQAQQMANSVENLLMWLSGALVPVHLFPSWLETSTKFLPATQGIITLRRIILEGQSLGAAWVSGDLPWLVVNSLAYLIIGWFVFKWCEKITRNRGSLGQY